MLQATDKSAVSQVERMGYDLVPHRKARGKKATFNDYAKVTWEPWTREPDMKPGELLPKNETLLSCGPEARMAYAVMLMTRDDLIAMHGKVDHDHVDKMVASFAETAETLKAIVLMLDTAYMRVLASAAAAHKRGIKFPGVHDMRKKKRTPRKA